MEEFETTIYQINKDIKPALEDIKYLYEKLVIKLDCTRSYIGGILNAIASVFLKITIRKQQSSLKINSLYYFNRS